MWHSLKTTDNSSFIHTQLKHLPTPPKPTKNRKKALLNSDSYNSSLSRAFSHAKQLSYFNPDLQYLITFTYKQNLQDPLTSLYDLKQFLKTENRKYSLAYAPKEKQNIPNTTNPNENNKIAYLKGKSQLPLKGYATKIKQTQRAKLEKDKETKSSPFKYIYVLEVQKRGAIHIHMIANTPFTTFINKNGYEQLKHWKHGFSSVLHIKQLDNNFRPYLYLFKYFKKAEKVGDSFIHTSRNFDKIEKVDYADYIERLSKENALYEEDFSIIENEQELNRIIKKYYRLEKSNE